MDFVNVLILIADSYPAFPGNYFNQHFFEHPRFFGKPILPVASNNSIPCDIFCCYSMFAGRFDSFDIACI